MATTEMDLLMYHGEHRGPQSSDRIEPVPPEDDEPRKKYHTIGRWSSYTVIALAIIWIVAVNVIHLHESRYTFTGAMIGLIIYAANYVWRLPKQDKPERGLHWTDLDK